MISEDMMESWSELTQQERDDYVDYGIIRGPVYKADPAFQAHHYICSFEAHAGKNHLHKYDLYVVPGSLDAQSVVLQHADGYGYYASSALFGFFNIAGHSPWSHALRLLQHFGKFTWERNK
jgi:hypothetical protein